MKSENSSVDLSMQIIAGILIRIYTEDVVYIK